MNFLNTNRIWLKKTAFNFARRALIGWLYGSHTYFTRRDDAMAELRQCMPGLTDKQHFALIPGILWETDYDHVTKKERVNGTRDWRNMIYKD